MNNSATDYVPARSSARNERDRILRQISDVDSQLTQVQQRSRLAPDPAYSRSEAVLQKTRVSLFEKLDVFDNEQKRIEAAEGSTAVKVARNKAYKAGKTFEQRLFAFAEACHDLKSCVKELAGAMQLRDAGRWPHPHLVESELSSRIVDVIGGAGGIPLQGYGSSLAKHPRPVFEHFE